MNADEADIAMRKLSRLAQVPPYERVYGWRQVLDRIWRAGFEAGYLARRRDEQISERVAEQEKPTATPEDAAAAERTRIAGHFDDMVVTREWRRRFEDRHAKHLSSGTVNGLLSAVADEIKGMRRG